MLFYKYVLSFSLTNLL